MQRPGKFLSALLWWVLIAGMQSPAWGEPIVTTTLLPAQFDSKPVSHNQEKQLWIRNNPRNDVFLQFDLSRLPEGLSREDFLNCTLRLVASDVTYDPGDGKNAGFPTPLIVGESAELDFTGNATSASIVALSTLSDTNSEKNRIAINRKASDKLTTALFNGYNSPDKKISLRLLSKSGKASVLFYAPGAEDPTNIPRLVIEYQSRPQSLLETLSWPQYQHDPEHSGQNPWRPSRTPTGFSLKTIPVKGNGSIASYPLLYRGNLYLVYTELNTNNLVALNFKGEELWRTPIGKGTVQRSPAISRTGIFYVLWEDKLAGYDLGLKGKKVGSYSMDKIDSFSMEKLTKLDTFTDLTVGNDGSLSMAVKQGDLNYIYGLTPDLQVFLKAGPFGKGQERMSTVSVSMEGRNIFAQNPEGALVVNIADPSIIRKVNLPASLSASEAYYHTPVAGREKGIMLFANYSDTASKGTVWGVSAALKPIWDSDSSISLPTQPVLSNDGKVYFIQDGVLKGHAYDQIGKPEAITLNDGEINLNSTSNLVVDGADNVYFWDNGTLWGIDTHAGKAFPTKINTKDSITGPQKFLRLMLGPDGTLWANNNNGNELFAFKPSYASGDLTLEQKDIKTQTVYRTQNDLRVGSVNVKAGTQLLFQAGNSIRLDKGFTVQKGASLLIRTDFRQAGL